MGPLIVIIVIVVVILWYRRRNKPHAENKFDVHAFLHAQPSYDLNIYKKKQYLFDTSSEFLFFNIVTEIIGADYYVFPQINYSHIIATRSGSSYENRRYRSHIEKKSADFVVCDKKTCMPLLVIDLDGSVHDRPDIHEKDVEIDEILKAINLPILRLTNEESKDRELVKEKIFKIIR